MNKLLLRQKRHSLTFYLTKDIIHNNCFYLESKREMTKSKELKFEYVKFFDQEIGQWAFVTPDAFDKDKHEGRIECPTTGCHAPISYVPEHVSNASNDNVSYCFRTNAHGEPHKEGCEYTPGDHAKKALNMTEALLCGDSILFNINFSTSFVREKGRLKATFARAAMAPFDGFFRQDWIDANKGSYSRYSGTCLEKVAKDFRAFEAAAKKVGASKDKLMVSYLHGLLPWSSFQVYDQKEHQSDAGIKTLKDVFMLLKNDMRAPSLKNIETFWSPTPLLRAHVQFVKTNKPVFFSDTWRSGNKIEHLGNTFSVQDVLHVRDPDIIKDIQSAKDVNFVATPFIRRKDTEAVLEKGKGYLHVNWPICSRDQLMLR